MALEAEVVGVNSARVSLPDLLEELKAEYTMSLEKELTFSWEFSCDMPVVKTDRAKLKNILDNFVTNAIKFTEKGHVAVIGRYVSQSNSVEFRVSDTGVGIPEEKLPIIFEMFRQLDGSETRPYGGVGWASLSPKSLPRCWVVKSMYKVNRTMAPHLPSPCLLASQRIMIKTTWGRTVDIQRR